MTVTYILTLAALLLAPLAALQAAGNYQRKLVPAGTRSICRCR